MNTCKTCKWWGRTYPGVCEGERGNVIQNGGDYPLTGHTYANSDRAGFAIHADASDDTGLTAHLVTGPDFGCVRWQAIPPRYSIHDKSGRKVGEIETTGEPLAAYGALGAALQARVDAGEVTAHLIP